jgi:hypothetical protein
MRSASLLAVAVLAVVLALSSAQNAFATVQLYYDNGTSNAAYLAPYGGVRFSLPSGVSSARLTYIRWSFFASVTLPLTIYVTGPDHKTQLSGSPVVLSGSGNMPAGTGCPAGWTTCHGLDVSSYGIIVTGDFFVITYKDTIGTPYTPEYDTDTTPKTPRSFYGDSLDLLVNSPDTYNFLIRVDIDPIAPVGGVMMPANLLALVAPWVAVIGLVGCIGVVLMVVKRRR